jgi:transcriptional regulatory protein RtcR
MWLESRTLSLPCAPRANAPNNLATVLPATGAATAYKPNSTIHRASASRAKDTPLADDDHDAMLAEVLSDKVKAKLDLFHQAQLAFVIGVCRKSSTLSDAGRKLFAATRENRKIANDADRLRKYLARFDLDWQTIKHGESS